jgi:hypothetical protein
MAKARRLRSSSPRDWQFLTSRTRWTAGHGLHAPSITCRWLKEGHHAGIPVERPQSTAVTISAKHEMQEALRLGGGFQLSVHACI